MFSVCISNAIIFSHRIIIPGLAIFRLINPLIQCSRGKSFSIKSLDRWCCNRTGSWTRAGRPGRLGMGSQKATTAKRSHSAKACSRIRILTESSGSSRA